MKFYTYKEKFITQKEEHWTGHIDSYFNKRFEFLHVNQLIIVVDEEVAEIIDLANSTDFNNREQVQKLISKTYNTVYEFIDAEGRRRMLIIDSGVNLKPFELSDISVYNRVLRSAAEHNLLENQAMIEFLFSINAYEDYVNYHSQRNGFLEHVSKTIEGLQL